MNENNDYLWIFLLMVLFAKPGIIVDPEKVKANMDKIKQVVKESNIDFYSINLEEIEAKSQEVYDLIEEYIT